MNNTNNSIFNTIAKLNMCGVNIIGYNNFGIAYIDNNDEIMLNKFTTIKGKVYNELLGPFIKVVFSSNFIVVNIDRQKTELGIPMTKTYKNSRLEYTLRANGLYVSSIKTNVMARYKTISVFGRLGNIYEIGNRDHDTMQDVLVVKTNTAVYLVNKEGNKVKLPEQFLVDTDFKINKGDNGLNLIRSIGTGYSVIATVDNNLNNLNIF